MAYKLTTMLSQLNALTVLQDTTANLTAATPGFSASPPHDGGNAAEGVFHPVCTLSRLHTTRQIDAVSRPVMNAA